MCILRCHEYLPYICETTFELSPYHTLKIFQPEFVEIIFPVCHKSNVPLPRLQDPRQWNSQPSDFPLTFSVPHLWQLSISHFQLMGSVSLNWCPVLTLLPVWVHWDFSALPPYSSQGVPPPPPPPPTPHHPPSPPPSSSPPLQPPWSAHPVVDAGLLDAKVLYDHRRPHY